MELNCPECGAPIAEADINQKAGIACCHVCDKMFVVARRGEGFVAAPADTVPSRSGTGAQAAGVRPAHFAVAEHDETLVITFPRKGIRQGWQLLSVAAFAIVFAAVLARYLLKSVPRPPAFFMFMAAAILIGATALVILVGGLYVTFGISSVVLSQAAAVFERRLFGLRRSEHADLTGVTRVQPFRQRQRTHIELFTCGLVIGERRYKFFHELGDAEMFRVAEVVNGFLKRVSAEDFASLLSPETEPAESESPDHAGS